MEFRFTMMKYDCSKTEPKQNTRGEKTKEMIKVNTSTCWENADQGQTQPKKCSHYAGNLQDWKLEYLNGHLSTGLVNLIRL